MTRSSQNPSPESNSRRNLLVGGLAGLGAAIVPSAHSSSRLIMPIQATPKEHRVAKVKSDFIFFDDPVAKLHNHLRMERDLAEQSHTLTWYHWIVFMVPIKSAPIPLMRYEGIEFSYLRHLGNNNFRLHAHNLSYPRDLNSGKFTDTVLNPVTGESLRVSPSIIINDPGTVQNPDGFRNVNGDGTSQKRYSMFRLENELIKMECVRGAPPEIPTTHQENSCQWCPFDEFTKSSITSLPSHFVGNYLYDYPRWLNMKKQPGHLSAMFDGKKVNSIDELPDEFLDRTRREYPELLRPRWEDFDKPLSFKL
ncbi:MAG: hypothetical protein ACI88A_002899 [Paraglaciecola sp.]|jgi:hypothetical protein